MTSEPSRFYPRRVVFDLLRPACVFLAALLLWEAIVRAFAIPPYVLPAPSLIASTLANDWPLLFASLLVTLRITFEALALAVIGGLGLAILLAQSKPIERRPPPFPIILHET